MLDILTESQCSTGARLMFYLGLYPRRSCLVVQRFDDTYAMCSSTLAQHFERTAGGSCSILALLTSQQCSHR